MSELEEVLVASQDAWGEWLDAHADAPGCWLVLANKGAALVTVTYGQAVEEALRRGWIDGQVRKRDAHSRQQRFTPRTRRSAWSQVNVGKAEALMAAGRMLPGGQAAVDAARADGRWDGAYAPPSTITVPPDLQAALDASPAAAAAFAALSGQNRYAVLHRIALPAVREGTRAGRIARFVAMLERGEAPH